jgi:ribosomal protein L11 methyltransferase
MGYQEEHWIAVNIDVSAKAVEAIEFAFNELDALGTAIDQLRRGNAEAIRVTGYFNEPPDEIILREGLNSALQVYGFEASAISDVSYGRIENTDWLGEWKKHWRPTTVGRFVIAPPWSEVTDADKFVIRIEPNMAFGTGTHETTQLCLKAIDESHSPNMSLLDVGTGTGILAIAAAKLVTEITKPEENISVSCVANILACDTDEDSVKIARENANANGVGDRIEFVVGSITSEIPTFDFVCANLTLDVITPLLPLLITKSRRLLLLSGILTEQEDAIIAELKNLQITNFEIEKAGEWISVLINVYELPSASADENDS